jgi:hypothetical protein
MRVLLLPPSPPSRWDYALDQRDAEIAELKGRLVEAEHRAKQAADKAAEDAAAAASELQVWCEGGRRARGHSQAGAAIGGCCHR